MAWCNRLTVGVLLAAAVLAVSPLQADEPKEKPEKGKAKQGVSDADVVASMKRGIDFLLKQKKDEHWEGNGKPGGQGNQYGGKTALALYALMHSGHSLLDDEEYASKLHWRSKEIQPTVEWLSKVEPEATYAASLMAAALSLAQVKPNTPTYKGLERCRDYLLDAIGDDGGYDYVDKKPGDGLERFKGAKLDAAMQTALDNALKHIQKLNGEISKAKKADDAIKLRTELAKAHRTYLDRMNEAYAAAEKLDNQSALRSLRAEYNSTLAEIVKNHERVVKHYSDAGKADEAKKWLEAGKKDLATYKTLGESSVVADNKNWKPIGDLSNAQYGTLGAWALADAGIEIPLRYWSISDRFWRLSQVASGSWGYKPNGEKERSSMGVAGIASLYVTTDMLDDELRLEPKPDKNLDRGIAWLDKAFSANTDDFYYLYGVERVGLASGLKFFGQTDWYKEGAAAVVSRQAKDGSWKGGFHGADQTVATSYALLFLARGRNAVVFNKLQYEGWWNARPRDNANVTHWMSKRFEKPINWQVVNMKVDPEQWLDAPVLLITGSKDPKWGDAEIAKLRSYVQAGGIIFSTSDGGSAEFTDAMKAAAEKVVERRYEMRVLDKSHQIFNIESEVKNPPQMLGMSNGIRDLWIHSTVDMGASWQMRRVAANPEHFNVAANLFFYASGKGSLRSKLAPLSVEAAGGAPARRITVARLDHGGNADPEPGAWKRFAKTAKAEFKTDIQVTPNVAPNALAGQKYSLVHITGSTALNMNEADSAALADYIKAGGTVFIDAAGGSAQFSNSVPALVKSIAGGETLVPIDPDDPLTAGTMADGVSCNQVDYRKFAKLREARMGKTPELQGVKIAGRWAVIYSRFDITSGLLGTNTWGIVGYDSASAEKIARNIVLYAAEKGGGAAAAAPR